MKDLVIDAQVLQTPALQRGMGQYVQSTIESLAKNNKDINIYILLSSSSKLQALNTNKFSTFKNVKIVYLDLMTLHESTNTKYAIERNTLIITDWVATNTLNPTFIIGALFQVETYPVFPHLEECLKLVICYDVIPLQRFKEYAPKMRWGDYLTRFSIFYKADRYLCISKTTANDIQTYASVNPDKIRIINGSFGEVSLIPKKPENNIQTKFVFMPTGNDIRKNNERAIRAFEQYRTESNTDILLIISSHFTEIEKANFSKMSPSIRFIGTVSNEEIIWYYKNCSAVMFPSLYEGLGMPIIEAMYFNKPIIASAIDVFMELTEEGVEYCNPYDTTSIKMALERALGAEISSDQQKIYEKIVHDYTWDNTAKAIKEVILQKGETYINDLPKIAIVGPHTTGLSAIGKVIGELHDELSRRFDIDYYYEKTHIDNSLRPDILGHATNYYPIQQLTDKKINSYPRVIYHIGNSSHHTITYARAMTHPSVVILHDLNLENIFDDLIKRNIIDERRKKVEKEISKSKKSQYIKSLVSIQKNVLTHSAYAEEIIRAIGCPQVSSVQLPIDTPLFYQKRKQPRFTFGMAGIIAGIKGIEIIERLAKHEEFIHDRILVFGLDFAEKTLMRKIRDLPNVEITTNLTDFEFQEKLKSLDVFVNFRTKYQGEASQATLESMRWGIPVIVRGDFGWYSELPDDSVVKAIDENDVVEKLTKLKYESKIRKDLFKKSREYTSKHATQSRYVDEIEAIVREK